MSVHDGPEYALDAKASLSRHNAMKFLPTIVRPPNPGYGINNALRIKGRTVADVEVGFREDIEGVHKSEAIIIRFTDGSILGIDTGSNAAGIACEHHSADEFHVDIKASFVPPPR